MSEQSHKSGKIALRGLLLAALALTVPAALFGAAPKKAPQVSQAVGETEITADRMEYNYAEAVAVMSDNVAVQDPQFRLTADKLFVFFEGTNTLNQIVVMGRVNVSNENRRVTCDKAVYTKSDGRLVMEGQAKLRQIQEDGKEFTVDGERITIWVDEQRVEITERPKIVLPSGSLNKETAAGKGAANERK